MEGNIPQCTSQVLSAPGVGCLWSGSCPTLGGGHPFRNKSLKLLPWAAAVGVAIFIRRGFKTGQVPGLAYPECCLIMSEHHCVLSGIFWVTSQFISSWLNFHLKVIFDEPSKRERASTLLSGRDLQVIQSVVSYRRCFPLRLFQRAPPWGCPEAELPMGKDFMRNVLDEGRQLSSHATFSLLAVAAWAVLCQERFWGYIPAQWKKSSMIFPITHVGRGGGSGNSSQYLPLSIQRDHRWVFFS